MLAAVEGDVAVGRLLIERGADIHASNNKEDSALALATHRGHTLFVDLLTLNGASLT
jgi:ankyrin repeat protein